MLSLFRVVHSCQVPICVLVILEFVCVVFVCQGMCSFPVSQLLQYSLWNLCSWACSDCCTVACLHVWLEHRRVELSKRFDGWSCWLLNILDLHCWNLVNLLGWLLRTQTVQQCESVRDDSVSNTVANINFKPVCHFGVPQNNKKAKAHYINPGIRYRCVCRSFSNLFNSIYQIISSPGLCIITVIITCVTCGQLASDRYLRFARCVKKDPFFVFCWFNRVLHGSGENKYSRKWRASRAPAQVCDLTWRCRVELSSDSQICSSESKNANACFPATDPNDPNCRTNKFGVRIRWPCIAPLCTHVHTDK